VRGTHVFHYNKPEDPIAATIPDLQTTLTKLVEKEAELQFSPHFFNDSAANVNFIQSCA